MKIKAVCEATGLTDRTIRYYIEEGLITPSYTENYLGRKTFDFLPKDMDELRDIAILQKFDFSIDEIRSIMQDAANSMPIIQNVKTRIEKTVAEGQSILCVLSQLDIDRTYTLTELATALSVQRNDAPARDEDPKKQPWRKMLYIFKYILTFIIVWSPIILTCFGFIVSLMGYYYPVFNFTVIAFALLCLMPSILILALSKAKFAHKRLIRSILLVLCVVCIPCGFFSSLFSVSYSQTTNIEYYRDLDATCIANRSLFFQELFPLWPNYFVKEKQPDGHYEDVYLDARYYYSYKVFMDYTYDIYAEWPLEQDEFKQEVARVTQLFEEKAPSEENRSKYTDYVKARKGNYKCLIIYDSYKGDPVFEEVTGSYTYYIFAYDEENLRVRYIFCDSLEDGADQPYYLSLDW